MSSATAIDWSTAPLGPGVTILKTHPGGLAALNKPAGVLSHPNQAGQRARSLLRATYDREGRTYSWPEAAGRERSVWLLHRLDSATSGVVLVAADEGLACAVRTLWDRQRVAKTYRAIVFGHPRVRTAAWRDFMNVKRDASGVRARAGGRLKAESVMRLRRLIPGPPARAEIELEPKTGRTHQLRHQCARRGLPIVGDRTYGDFQLNREFTRRTGTDRLYLHALKISVDFVFRGSRVRFSATAPLPREFKALAHGA